MTEWKRESKMKPKKGRRHISGRTLCRQSTEVHSCLPNNTVMPKLTHGCRKILPNWQVTLTFTRKLSQNPPPPKKKVQIFTGHWDGITGQKKCDRYWDWCPTFYLSSQKTGWLPSGKSPLPGVKQRSTPGWIRVAATCLSSNTQV